MARDKVFLVIVQPKSGRTRVYEDLESELRSLTLSAGGEIAGSMKVTLERPTSNIFITKGKLSQLSDEVKTLRASVVIANVDLSPVQCRNIESSVGVRVVDRTGLILDIFARRAKSHAGRLQVELAQLNYLLPRLSGQGVLMSRLGGGIGTRGPGEQKLEIDRRRIRARIDKLKEDLKKLKTHQELIRSRRKRSNSGTVALIGYTNAGKSTLLNALTGSNVLVEDRLFATLDPTTRALSGNSGREILLTDTIGFLVDLPHALIEAFRSTLEEVVQTDLLVHVVDASDPAIDGHKSAVEKVLEELGAKEKPVLLALNKIDRLTPEEQKMIGGRFPEGILISAREKNTLKELIDVMKQKLLGLRVPAET